MLGSRSRRFMAPTRVQQRRLLLSMNLVTLHQAKGLTHRSRGQRPRRSATENNPRPVRANQPPIPRVETAVTSSRSRLWIALSGRERLICLWSEGVALGYDGRNLSGCDTPSRFKAPTRVHQCRLQLSMNLRSSDLRGRWGLRQVLECASPFAYAARQSAALVHGLIARPQGTRRFR